MEILRGLWRPITFLLSAELTNLANDSETPNQHITTDNNFMTADLLVAAAGAGDEEIKILTGMFKEHSIFLGGGSLGKGLKKAAVHYLTAGRREPEHFQLQGANDLVEGIDHMPREESFYVVDLGVVISQMYQWRRAFPRVEPFYAVKCNPDPLIIKTLALFGCNFDCASRNEIRLVQECTKDLPQGTPDIIYANPCKARGHVLEAVCKGIRLMTFDNAAEIEKCAGISKSIQLILRIITDDRGSQCRLSTKFGAPRHKWRSLLAAAKKHGLAVVGVSFHVGSGCRDSTRYELALKDAREIFDMAEKEFHMKMHILDIGGGFPGETHSMWNPATEIDEDEEEDAEGKESSDDGNGSEDKAEAAEPDRFMFFNEIAEAVAPIIDELFPVEEGVRVIGEPGRYFVAACTTLCCSIVSTRNNAVDSSFQPEAVDDNEMSAQLRDMTRDQEDKLVHRRGASRGMSLSQNDYNEGLMTLQEELGDYAKLFASQQLAQQEVDVYNDALDFYNEGLESATDMLGPPSEEQQEKTHHTVEGMSYPLIVNETSDENNEDNQLMTSMAAAGEAVVNGMVLQAIVDSLQDDYAYYINDGVYGAFNNIMFDHANVRPRVLRLEEEHAAKNQQLYACTVFGPTCDSIDCVARSVLLPPLKVGDWLYFQNMGAYTMAAASDFNGFEPSDKMYVCSIPPEFFGDLLAGPEEAEDSNEEKKDDDN